MLKKIQKKIQNIKKVFTIENFTQILIDIFESGMIEDDVIKLIQDRLYKKGTDADNKKLKTASAKGNEFYSPFTQSIKEANNQKTSNVTLKDSGDFYQSMDGEVKDNKWSLIADFTKKNGEMFNNFSNMYSNNEEFKQKILDLSEKEKITYIKTKILPEFLIYLKQELHEL